MGIIKTLLTVFVIGLVSYTFVVGWRKDPELTKEVFKQTWAVGKEFVMLCGSYLKLVVTVIK